MARSALTMIPEDRRCRPRALQNPLRRSFAPASREVDRLGLLSGQVVADLGAGVGYFDPEILGRIGDRGRLYVVEPDENNLNRARSRLGPDPRVGYRASSAAHIPEIASDSVDRALLSLVICCLVDKEGALDEAWRILRPAGVALISYPRRRRPFARGASLRVTPERWKALEARHPWIPLPVRSSWVVQRHLLQKPSP